MDECASFIDGKAAQASHPHLILTLGFTACFTACFTAFSGTKLGTKLILLGTFGLHLQGDAGRP